MTSLPLAVDLGPLTDDKRRQRVCKAIDAAVLHGQTQTALCVEGDESNWGIVVGELVTNGFTVVYADMCYLVISWPNGSI